MPTIADFSVVAIDGTVHDLARHRGKVVLVVNTASACGYTPQFAGLEALWRREQARGLVVLGFPCNQFGRQDPGSNAEIGSFCQKNHGVSFPMMSRIEVNGDGAEPLFRWLKDQAPGLMGTRAIKWNFTKFLIGRDGRVRGRHAPQTRPEALQADISAALDEPAGPHGSA